MALSLVLSAMLPGAAVGQADTIPVAARDLPRGVVLEAADIAYRPRADRATPPVGSRAVAEVGWVTRRMMREGEPLREPAVSPPILVKSGEEVQLLWSDGELELRLRGRAMNSATVGGKVTVRVDMTRRFEGVAVGAGLVRLDSQSRSR